MTHPVAQALQDQRGAIYRSASSVPPSSRRSALKRYQTSNEVARLLGEWGYEVHRGLAGTGSGGHAARRRGKNALACGRIWMPLPMQERSGKPWASQVEGALSRLRP